MDINERIKLNIIFSIKLFSMKNKYQSWKTIFGIHFRFKMSSIRVDRRLPPELSIQSIDDILYSIGLCHSSVREDPKRSKLHNPIVIAIIEFIHLLMKFISILTDDEKLLSILDDFTHLIGFKLYFIVMLIVLNLITIFSQCVYYYNYRMGVKPTFLRVFGVMSGSVTPISVGLTHERQVTQLLKYGKWLQKLLKIIKITTPFFATAFIIFTYVYSGKIYTTSPFIIAYHVVFSTFWCYYCFIHLIIQLMVFFILCEYLVMKVSEQNRMLSKEKRMTSRRIRKILHSFDRLIREISEYNVTYWSKFVFNVWLMFGFFQVIILYFIIFLSVPLFLRIIVAYYLFIFIILYVFVMSIVFINQF